MRRVFVRFLEEIEDFKMAFWKYLTFTTNQMKALGRAPHSTEAKVKAPHWSKKVVAVLASRDRKAFWCKGFYTTGCKALQAASSLE